MKQDVVVVMVSDTWSDSIRRGFYSTADQTILSLLESPSIGRVLVADHPRGLLSQVKRRMQGDRPAPSSGRLRGARPSVVRTRQPTDPARMARRYVAYDRQLAVASKLRGLKDPAVVTFNLHHAATGSPWASSTTFYAQDDEASIPRLAPYAALARDAYRDIDLSHTSVLAVTRSLLNRVAPINGGLVIPNGIDPTIWGTIAPKQSDNSNRRPVAVYAGTIDDRLDLRAIKSLAAGGFVVRMVGPITEDAVGRALQNMPGVMLHGSVDRESVSSILTSADICILTHKDTPLTQAMSPIKLFEYIASGTPVVATRLGGTESDALAAGRVVFVSPDGDYVSAARDALERGRLAETERRHTVRELSWRRRHEALIDHLRHASHVS